MKKKRIRKDGTLRLTPEVREQMFQVYQETGNVNQVKIRCGIHSKTVKRYRRVDDWDSRLAAIKERVESKLETRLVSRRLRNVRILDLAIEDVQSQLIKARERDVAGVIDPKLLARLVVAQDHLLGRGAADEDVSAIPAEIREALEFLASLGEVAVKQLADIISERLSVMSEGQVKVLTGPVPEVSPDDYKATYTGVVKRKPKAKSKGWDTSIHAKAT